MRTCIAFSILSILAVGCRRLPEPNFRPAEPNLKVVTYNVNFGFVQSQNVTDFLIDANADIVCLQETHSYWETSIKQALGGIYPYSVFEAWSGAGGIAILSKQSLRNIKLIEPSAGWFPALKADAYTPIGTTLWLAIT